MVHQKGAWSLSDQFITWKSLRETCNMSNKWQSQLTPEDVFWTNKSWLGLLA